MPIKRVTIRCPRCDGTGVYDNAHFKTYERNVCRDCGGTGRYESITVEQTERPSESSWEWDSPPVDSLLTLDERATVDSWRMEFPACYSYLDFLRQFEPDRFVRAVASIVEGRGRAVAEALEPWYVDYRARNGWGPGPRQTE